MSPELGAIPVDELADVWCRLGVAPRALPHAKAGHRPQWATAAEMFTDADCEFIAEVCQREIASFGYTPPRLSE